MSTSETANSTAARPHFLYFADPMCSWCYGFAPIIERLQAHFADRLALRIVVGGLRAGNTTVMRDRDRAYIRSAWERVHDASGQPFDFSFFDRKNFIYDTEPACRAVVAIRERRPEMALAMMSAIANAFYADNRDVTQNTILAEVAAEVGEDPVTFLKTLIHPELRQKTMQDFLFAQQLNVQGFPCLLVGNEASEYTLITSGYSPIDALIDAVERWLETLPD